jgi:hypothetical protein
LRARHRLHGRAKLRAPERCPARPQGGLFNAVAELENFRDGDTLNQAAYSVLFGLRGAAMERAFSAAVLRTKRATLHTRSVAEMRGRQGGAAPTPPKLQRDPLKTAASG